LSMNDDNRFKVFKIEKAQHNQKFDDEVEISLPKSPSTNKRERQGSPNKDTVPFRKHYSIDYESADQSILNPVNMERAISMAALYNPVVIASGIEKYIADNGDQIKEDFEKELKTREQEFIKKLDELDQDYIEMKKVASKRQREINKEFDSKSERLNDLNNQIQILEESVIEDGCDRIFGDPVYKKICEDKVMEDPKFIAACEEKMINILQVEMHIVPDCEAIQTNIFSNYFIDK